jgi:hypothetical protein
MSKIRRNSINSAILAKLPLTCQKVTIITSKNHLKWRFFAKSRKTSEIDPPDPPGQGGGPRGGSVYADKVRLVLGFPLGILRPPGYPGGRTSKIVDF